MIKLSSLSNMLTGKYQHKTVHARVHSQQDMGWVRNLQNVCA